MIIHMSLKQIRNKVATLRATGIIPEVEADRMEEIEAR